MEASYALVVNLEFCTAITTKKSCEGKQSWSEDPSLDSTMCVFVYLCVSENSCDCEKGNEVRPRCASVGDDRSRSD